jgi:DNA repair exonuclease SbcCD nuclease subunit
MTIQILHAADIHIKLRKNKVNEEWQLNRFRLFFKKMLELEKSHQITVLAGDIFDEAPELDEVTLFVEYLHQVTKPTIIIPGNHEATKKGETFLEGFVRDQAINNGNVKFFTKNATFEFNGYTFQMFPYTEVQKDNLEDRAIKEILVTHIRGEVPPHITPEYDFEKIKEFRLVLCGDLHFYHKYKNYNVFYPGSPLSITFDRNDNKKYGVISHTFWKEGHSHTFIDLGLPKLLRKKIKAGEELVKDPYNWVVYEVEGKLEDIQKVKKTKSELLDKTIIDLPHQTSALDLKGLSLLEEVDIYLKYSGVVDTQPYIKELNDLGIQ